MAVTWSGTDKTANVTVSGGSLVATTTSATAGGVRANTSFASGKQYYEVLLSVIVGANYGIGWANATAALTAFIGNDKNGTAVFPNTTNSQFWYNNVNQGTLGVTGATTALLQIAIDIGGKLVWFRYNGQFWNGSATADPGGGTGGLSLSTINAGPYFPVFCANGSGASVTANFGATAFLAAIPSGFSALDTNTITYAASSKFLGYAVLAPAAADVVSSKFLGYAVLAPAAADAVSSKFLGYAVLQPVPGNFNRINLEWLPPKLPVRRWEEPAQGLNICLYPPTLAPIRNVYPDIMMIKPRFRPDVLGCPQALLVPSSTQDNINIYLIF